MLLSEFIAGYRVIEGVAALDRACDGIYDIAIVQDQDCSTDRFRRGIACCYAGGSQPSGPVNNC